MKQLSRKGMICKKLCMSQVFDDKGKMVPVTVLHAEKNYVLNVFKHKQGSSVQLAAYDQKSHRVSKSLKGVFGKAKVALKKKIKEFRIQVSEEYKVGSEVLASQFAVGEYLDISGISIGKGFAGGMKRHNFRGLEASHGVSISHRSIGSTGQCQDPGKVFKGKKMPGHLGACKVTSQNCEIIDIDNELELIIVKGSVPGPKNNYLFIQDAVKKSLSS